MEDKEQIPSRSQSSGFRMQSFSYSVTGRMSAALPSAAKKSALQPQTQQNNAFLWQVHKPCRNTKRHPFPLVETDAFFMILARFLPESSQHSAFSEELPERKPFPSSFSVVRSKRYAAAIPWSSTTPHRQIAGPAGQTFRPAPGRSTPPGHQAPSPGSEGPSPAPDAGRCADRSPDLVWKS